MTFQIVMIAFDGMTDLDFSSPFDIFARFPDSTVIRTSLSGKDVVSDLGVKIAANIALEDVRTADLLFIGGGPGSNALMEDAAMISHLQRLAEGADWVTSVCTGALVLGAAGLLRGYNATTHWAAMDALNPLGATPTKNRVVIDRNRITGGGVTAGIDFALTVAQKLYGDEKAQGMQLACEYAPQPPFNSGHPDVAPQEVLKVIEGRFALSRQARIDIAEKVAAGWEAQK